MLMTFDVSCADTLFPAHTFIARGLADGGRLRDDLTSQDHSLNEECQMVDLVYELVPGVPQLTRTGSRPSTVDATYGADVSLPWSTGGTGPGGLGGPGWLEKFQGGESTIGGLGPWPVPDAAQRLTFWLHDVDNGTCRGALHIDLQSRSVDWVPAEPARNPS
jgi:hypothetical protein